MEVAERPYRLNEGARGLESRRSARVSGTRIGHHDAEPGRWRLPAAERRFHRIPQTEAVGKSLAVSYRLPCLSGATCRPMLSMALCSTASLRPWGGVGYGRIHSDTRCLSSVHLRSVRRCAPDERRGRSSQRTSPGSILYNSRPRLLATESQIIFALAVGDVLRGRTWRGYAAMVRRARVVSRAHVVARSTARGRYGPWRAVTR